jgi:predicted alpha-1,2-mannosidase
MKFSHFVYLLIMALLPMSYATPQTAEKTPVDYVNPNMGGIGQMLSATSPNVIMPYGIMRISPITTPGINDRYLADKIFGFPAGGMTLMPMTGPAETDPSRYSSLYDHDLETATPYYYSAILEKHDIKVEYTVSAHAAYYRLTFPEGKPAHVLLSVPQTIKIDLMNTASLSGGSGGGRGGRGGFFYAEFSRPVTSFDTLTVAQPSQGRGQGGSGGFRVIVNPGLNQARQVELRIGISGISLDQARQNLKNEIPAWDFDRTKAQARKIWNEALGTIQVKGGTEDQRTIFYTSLYRVLTSVSNVVEDGKYYSSFDKQLHSTDGHGFYPIGAGAAMWGNYRSLEPLHLLLDPQEQVDLIRSFIALYEQTGTMSAINRGLSGHHIIAVALDAYMKGYRDFDVEKAYEAFKKLQLDDTFLPWRNVPQTSIDRFYLEKGYFPSLKKDEKETVEGVHPFERRQAVAVTLETTYDDWCMAEWAKALNKKEDYDYFSKRAHNYENVFDKRVDFMVPKSADGNWVLDEKEFSPIWSGGQGGREYYTEMNGWIYTFHVQQDVAGLINLMGGREKFITKLDRLFQEQFSKRDGTGNANKYYFQAQFPDMTGLIGQYAQGNEPSFHIPYLYNYGGAPWMTQRRVRDIMKIWFNAGPLGFSGDEDNGEESSWYVFSAMGFFTVCPGRPVYDIGSPVFDEVRLTLAGGKVFTITARNVSAANKYIQSATLNSKPLNKPWFEHKDMVNGGSMVFEMGPRPNTAWGSAPEAAPPSMSR